MNRSSNGLVYTCPYLTGMVLAVLLPLTGNSLIRYYNVNLGFLNIQYYPNGAMVRSAYLFVNKGIFYKWKQRLAYKEIVDSPANVP